MTDHEFDERFRGKYRAAASSWTPDAKTKNALLEKLQPAPAPRRTAARMLRPAAAVCCCLVIGAAAVFALRSQPQTDGIALTAVTEDESAAAAMFAAPAEGDAAPAAAEDANGLAKAANGAAEAAPAEGDAAPAEGDAASAVQGEAANDAGSAGKAQARDVQNGVQTFSGEAEASSGARLTQEEIDALREQYPIANPAASPLVTIVPPSLSDVMERSDTFVYGEVVGVETVEKVLSTGNESLDAKRQGAGAGEVSFQVLTLRVIEDTAGLFGEGEEISLWTDASLAEYGPQLTEGMRAVLPAAAYGSEGRYDTSYCGAYYVTPEGFVLSAFDEEQCGGSWNGVLVEELLAGLRG